MSLIEYHRFGIVHAVPGTALPGGPGRRAPARGLSSTDMPTAGLRGTYSMVDHEVVTEETAYGDLKEDPMWATYIFKACPLNQQY